MSTKAIYRIPSLDGIRGLSILMVVFGHAFRNYFHHIDIANLGVRIFFIISAYLIVGVLKNSIIKGRFSLKSFYFKRMMRTFPAFYFYIFCVYILLRWLDFFDLNQFWRAPVYLENYHSRSLWESQQWFVGHSWSLAVEEQFYILVSVLFLMVNKNKITFKIANYIFLLLFFSSPVLRASFFIFDFYPDVITGSIHRSFETVVDSIAIGGIIALTPSKIIEKNKIVNYFKNKTFILFALVLGIQFLNSVFVREIFGLKIRFIYNLFGISIINISLAIIMFNSISQNNSSIFKKTLNSKILSYIGLLSYSIYLWQQIWLYKWNIPLALKFIGIIFSALISYYLIEKPSLNFRNKLLLKYKK